jgi:hypothetical protein
VTNPYPQHGAVALGKAAQDHLKKAIADYRAGAGNDLSQDGQKVLNSLAKDGRAADAFVAVLPNGDRWHVLLGDCIKAEERARTLKKRARALRDKIQKAPRALKAVDTIADFFYGSRSKLDLSKEAYELVRARDNGREDPERCAMLRDQINDPINQALSLLRSQINEIRRHYRDFLSALSRKTDALAARTEGIAWLRESVWRLSKRAHDEHVATLAQIVLGDANIDIGNVRKAVMPHAAWTAALHKTPRRNTGRKVSRSKQPKQQN